MSKNQNPSCWDKASLPGRRRSYTYFLHHDQPFTTKKGVISSLNKTRSIGSGLLSNIIHLILIAAIYLFTDLIFPTGWAHANAHGAQEPSLDLVVSATDLSVGEGDDDGASFTVRLNRQPDTTLTVTIEKTNDDITQDKTSLSFDNSNWNVEQKVTLTAEHDNDGVDDTDTITVSLGTISKEINITIEDDDTAGLTLSPTSLIIDEGESGTFTVKLDTEPSGDVTVAVTKSGVTWHADVTVDKASLIFTTSNWNQAQTVTVSALVDVNIYDGKLTLEVNSSGGGYDSIIQKTLTVIVNDNDSAGIFISPPTLEVKEGSSVEFTVRPFVSYVEKMRLDIDLQSNDDLELDTIASLYFEKSNHNIPQRIKISAAPDSDDEDETAILQIHLFVYTDPYDDFNYKGLTHRTTISVIDDNTLGLVTSPESLDIDEGSEASLSVRLNRSPSSSLSVSLANESDDITLTPSSLSFDSTNWRDEQTVQISARHDDDAEHDTDTITLSANNVQSKEINATVYDDEKIISLVISPENLDISEGGAGSLAISLGHKPTGGISVSLSNENSDIVLSKSSLEFIPSNWNKPQIVTVTAMQDNDNTDDADTITLSGTNVMNKTIPITIDDDESITLVVSPDSLDIHEGGAGSFSVRLSHRPAKDISVLLSNENSDIILDEQQIVFNASNWNMMQEVTLRAIQDDNDAADETDIISVSATGFTKKTIDVDIDDDETLALMVTPERLDINEGDTGSFTMRLNYRPAEEVLIYLTNINSDIKIDKNLTLKGTSMTLHPSSWNIPNTVNLTAIHDDDFVNDTDTISIVASGVADKEIDITIHELSLSVSHDSLDIDEGNSRSFEVSLSREPRDDVTVMLSKNNPDITLSDSSLRFNSSNWSTRQEVTVTVAEDDDTIPDIETITLNASGGGYDSIARKSVNVKVKDNDEVGLVIVTDADPLTVGEGESNTFTVRLKTEPSANVTLTLTQPTNTDVTVDLTSLTFTPSTWNVAQTVTVSAAEDNDDTADESASISVSATG
ncbi:COG1470 family protein, partial [Thioalkalivibrio sp. HK1]|uniref:COG1470 family protein n=1 Tax=Thioalkalivibrio sp. HK1 TaxID=1469245 RepID=UPI0012DF2420